MPRLSVAEKLKVAIEEAAVNADLLKIPSRQAAEEFYDEQYAAVEPLAKGWIIEKLASIIGSHRAKSKRASNSQLVFEEALGFKRLPPKWEFGGAKVARPDATIEAFRKLASQLAKTESPALRDVNRIIALMSQYTAREKRITWAEVAKREAEKLASPPK